MRMVARILYKDQNSRHTDWLLFLFHPKRLKSIMQRILQASKLHCQALPEPCDLQLNESMHFLRNEI